MSTLEARYRERFASVLTPLADRLQSYLRDLLKDLPHVDRVGTRAKSVDRFTAKAEKVVGGKRKYSDPLVQIQDQIGARVVVFYLRDVEAVAARVDDHLRKIETKAIVPDGESEFGYFGRHFILFLPSELFDAVIPQDKAPKFFELQIKTLYQHAWAEANHDLAYKPPEDLSSDDRRKIAFTAAQSWGADQIFDDLFGRLVANSQSDASEAHT
jgi:putative GTP pyrophosphokinase